MERLWSPWRSAYIDSLKDKSDDGQCVFCIAKEESIDNEKSLVIFNDELVFTILNKYPYNNGHLMVVPKNHFSDLSELSSDEFYQIARQIKIATEALKKIYNPQGFNIGANIGKAAGAGIDSHLHFHVVPRWNGDTNFMTAVGDVKVISHELIETKINLTKTIKKLLDD